jgi:hypothetical protein
MPQGALRCTCQMDGVRIVEGLVQDVQASKAPQTKAPSKRGHGCSWQETPASVWHIGKHGSSANAPPIFLRAVQAHGCSRVLAEDEEPVSVGEGDRGAPVAWRHAIGEGDARGGERAGADPALPHRAAPHKDRAVDERCRTVGVADGTVGDAQAREAHEARRRVALSYSVPECAAVAVAPRERAPINGDSECRVRRAAHLPARKGCDWRGDVRMARGRGSGPQRSRVSW